VRVLILGAGLAGITTAFELLEDGHEVTVLDRHAEPASETSFANGGLISVGHALAWANPRAPARLLKSLFRDGQPIRFRPRADLALWRWSAKFLAQCTAGRARHNTLVKHRLCRYGQERLQAVAAATGIAYDGERRGVLYFYRTQETLDRGARTLAILKEQGQEMEVVDRERAAAIDPALAPSKDRIAGGIFCPTDESGDACTFARGLARLCAERGARLLLDREITGIVASGDKVENVVTDEGEETADAYVLALGSWSPLLARQIGERLSVYPIKGYTATIPIDGANNPPTIGGIDEDNLTAYARLGDRLRIASVAEFAGYDTSYTPADFAPMLRTMRELFPAAGDWSRVQYWACLRPMTPEGTPVLGRGRHRNLYYCTGLGHMGWTMASGTARITADLIGGRAPAIPLEGMTLR